MVVVLVRWWWWLWCGFGGGFFVVVVLILVRWWWWVSTEPGFKKEENDLRWNVHQLHFLWAGEWGLGMGL